jgi:hypothetical protein
LHYIVGELLGQEDYFYAWDETADLPSRLEAIQCRETDVEDDQVWFKLFGFMDSGQPV